MASTESKFMESDFFFYNNLNNQVMFVHQAQDNYIWSRAINVKGEPVMTLDTESGGTHQGTSSERMSVWVRSLRFFHPTVWLILHSSYLAYGIIY